MDAIFCDAIPVPLELQGKAGHYAVVTFLFQAVRWTPRVYRGRKAVNSIVTCRHSVREK